MKWQLDKSWSDRFIPEIKSILGQTLIEVATDEEDALRNTDLITLQLPGQVRMACRVRKHKYLSHYADEFTLRCSRPSGVATEIDKVLDGWGDYLFYGFSSADEAELAHWFIGDLAVFRRWFAEYRKTHRDWPGELKRNADGSSEFVVFSINDIDRSFVVSHSDPIFSP